MNPLYINGRFLLQRQTGVQRFAQEVVRAIDQLLDAPDSGWRGDVRLVTPAGVRTPPWLRNLRHVASGTMGQGYAWEQFDLPRLTMDGVLLNLCNLAPVAKRRQVVVLHDASTKARPESFSLAFRMAYATLVPLICSRASQLVSVSQFSRAEISRWFGVPASRLSVCYEGAEHILTEPANETVLDQNRLRGARYVLAVGMGPANKNLEVLLDGFARAALPDVHLVLTGRRAAHVYGGAATDLPDGAIHVGHVSDAELRGLYEHALALVYPSSYEGFGLPPLEAMACGCPVIVSDQAALLEVSGDAACVVGIKDPQALANSLVRFSSDEPYRAEFAKRGLACARRFTWQATARHLLTQCRTANN
jgi:glycosyltransferase involved in cell wall biosynthesis